MTTVLSLTDVNDFWDVLAILLIVMGPVCGAAVPLIVKQRAYNREVSDTLAAVRDNVQNGHDTPLRADLDQMMSKLDYVIRAQRAQGKDIAGIREEIRTERIERIAGDKRRDE